MKYIFKPTYVIKIEGNEFGLEHYIRYLLDATERFTKDAKGIRSAVKIDQAISKEGSHIALEDEDYTRLAAASAEPGVPYPVRPVRALMPFLEAIEKALDTEPENKVEESTKAEASS